MVTVLSPGNEIVVCVVSPRGLPWAIKDQTPGKGEAGG